MAARDIDIAAEVARLESMSTYRLRREWARVQWAPAPARFSRDLLIRGITYKMQDRAFGGLAKSHLRKLSADRHGAVGTSKRRAASATIKPGTRLVREWHGITHSVLVLDDGVEWNGCRYRSLSVVARKITGAHWSGPRFFGLTRREQRPNE